MQSLLCFCTLRPQLLLLLLLLLQLPPLSFAAAPVAETITVDHRGGGDFRTVQAAVDSVPDGNREWIRIHVKKGNYREKVTVPTHKHYILLEGDGCWKTAISYGAHAHAGIGHIMRRRRRRNVADYGIVRNIDFKVVAALVGGDKIAFYGCAFHGFQDTLCDFTGRHYFRRCAITGGIDFIFATAITSTLPPGRQQPGWVTAHARAGACAACGLVFRGGSVDGTGRQYLGRTWNRFATVVFYRTDIAGVVVPQGWQAWHAAPDICDICRDWM
uniref:pectinesterase n=1 Tax=Oryza punctata TaxID=4537 RepID=A0A0E0LP76_ORYPU